ncbi:MAG: hypothetical protein ABSE86_35910 [Bryobacteraceae bacterium]|jgi:hypothetical protein
MTSLMEITAQLLEPNEREAVVGDLEEAGESTWRGLRGVLGLVIRRQAALWKSWQPWVAAFGLALPFSFMLMGFSLSVGWSYQRFIGMGAGFWPLISRLFLLVAWSWTGGFVVGSLSRRTLWMSIAATCSPCLFCLARFRESSLPSICLLLFLGPAIAGVLKGLQITQIKLFWAIILAIAITLAMIPMGRITWVLVWPAWYMAATAWKTERETA